MAKTRGKIIKILSERAFIIDLGSQDNVFLNNIIHIVQEGEEIDSSGSTTTVEYVKAVLRVSHVQANICTCIPAGVVQAEGTASSDLYRTVSSDMARVAMERSPYGEKTRALDVKSSEISGLPSLSPISIGDTAVLMPLR